MKTKEEKRIYHREWVYKNKDKVSIHATNYKKRKCGSVKAFNLITKYGITLEKFNKIIEEQGNKCKICGVTFDESNRATRPHMDHSHITNQVRGVLCRHCNLGLGNFRDNRDLLQAATDYLSHYE